MRQAPRIILIGRSYSEAFGSTSTSTSLCVLCTQGSFAYLCTLGEGFLLSRQGGVLIYMDFNHFESLTNPQRQPKLTGKPVKASLVSTVLLRALVFGQVGNSITSGIH